MGQLRQWRMQTDDDGRCSIIGLDQRGFRHVMSSDAYAITEFDSDYICVDGMDGGRHFLCRFRDIHLPQPMRPTGMARGIPRKASLWYAINDLLAEGSRYAAGLSGVLDLAGLRERYPGMYDNVDMRHVVRVVLKVLKMAAKPSN